MIIVGINAHHADAAACIVVDGKLVAAAEEERFRRIKHWAGFPTAAIRYCLDEARVDLNDVDHIAANRDPTPPPPPPHAGARLSLPPGALPRAQKNPPPPTRPKTRALRAEIADELHVTSL